MLVQLWNLYDLPWITHNPTGVNLSRTFTNANDLLAAKDKAFRDCEPGPGDQKKCWCQVGQGKSWKWKNRMSWQLLCK